MSNKFSNIKERILYILENKGITKSKFFEDIGVTYGNFTGKAKETPLNSTTLGIIFSKYPDINLEWLLTGEGSMLKNNEKSSFNQSITGDSNIQSGNDTNITGDCVKQIKKLELELRECKTKLEEKDKTISQLVNLMSSK